MFEWRKNKKKEQLLTKALWLLFVLLNDTIIEITENEMFGDAFDSNIKAYIGNTKYIDFVAKHKGLSQSVKGGEETLAFYAEQLIPSEPLKYPSTVRIAQIQYPRILLEIFTLELLFFLSFNIKTMIDNHYDDLDMKFYEALIPMFMFAGWSKEGTKKVIVRSKNRIDEYEKIFRSVDDGTDLYKLGSLASKHIFNSNDLETATGFNIFLISTLKHYSNILK